MSDWSSGDCMGRKRSASGLALIDNLSVGVNDHEDRGDDDYDRQRRLSQDYLRFPGASSMSH